MDVQRVGRYKLLEPIGRGAIGDVYKALDPDLNREVAVKIITRPTALDSDELQKRFRREVQLAARLNHPHIISVYDVSLDLKQPYLVTELLAGGTLEAYLEQGELPWSEALALLAPICQALGYAHEAGIIHRDVKPGNIMFAADANRTIKLADFGLAHRQDEDRLTQSGGIVGTIAYMSPEQANGEAVDARTDIFSLGLILFEAIAGYNPLRGETVSRTLLNAVSYEPIDLSAIQNQVPEQVLALLEVALARERRSRYGSCAQLGQDIAACLDLGELPSEFNAIPAPDAPDLAPETIPTVQIENAPGLDLPPNAGEILREMFADYGRVSITEELAGGFSGSRVLVVRPVRRNRNPELPAVVKMAPLRLIEQEWQAYQAYIRDQLSGVTEITGEPVFPLGASWGGLRYKLVGSGAIEFDSLGEAYHTKATGDLLFILKERLFARLAALWRFNNPTTAFHLAASYDHLLPVNLMIRPGETLTDATIPVIRAGVVGVPVLAPGDPVRLSGFVISEIDEDNGVITLDWPADEERPPGSFRVRLQPMLDLENIQVDLVIDGIEGVVTSTRREIMRSDALEVLGWDFDTEAEAILLPGGRKLPNPLARLPAIMAATPTVRLANIHGDLNPENILVDPATRDVRLIDFATARRDHVLHDFLRLETGIVTRLLPMTVKASSLPPESIIHFYEQLHCATFARPGQASPDLRHDSLEKPFAMLVALRKEARTYFFNPTDWSEYYQGLVLYLMGALKYKNLNKTAKQIAFYGAATAQRLLEEPPPCQEYAAQDKAASLVSSTAIRKVPPEPAQESEPAPEEEEVVVALETPASPARRNKGGAAPAFPAWLRDNWLLALLLAALLTVFFVAIIPEITGGKETPTPTTALPARSDSPTQAPSIALNTPSPAATTSPTNTPTEPAPSGPAPTSGPNPTFPVVDVSRREATITILLDTSATMNEGKTLINALDGVRVFIERLDDEDTVAVYQFGGTLLELQPSGRVAVVRDDLIQKVAGLYAAGETLLYDAICQAAGDLAQMQSGDIEDERSYTIILLTDGQDSGAGTITTEEEVLACLNEAMEQTHIQIIAMAFGADDNHDLLKRLVEASEGQLLTTTPDNVLEQLATLTLDP